ncbi:MAG: chemotaxis protein CheX [Acidobacteria bacterium]|nr:chemotaxis protein CheX [Acidobacteriota bacterium]
MYTTTQTVNTAPIHPFGQEIVPTVLTEQTVKAAVDSFTKICGAVEVIDDDPTDFAHGKKIDGIISFVGDITWSLILVLPFRSAEMMAQKFAGFEIPFDSEDMGDVVGELTNVLAGVLCGGLESVGVHSQMSLPTVTSGSDFEQLMSENLITQRLFFMTNDHHFMVKLVVARHK